MVIPARAETAQLRRRPVEIFEIDEAFFAQKFGRTPEEDEVGTSEAEMVGVAE
jgi:hypothetical protein